MTTTTKTRTATPAEVRAVVHITFGAPGPRQGVVTGIVTDRNAAVTVVRLYSAGCLHDVLTIPTASIVKEEAA